MKVKTLLPLLLCLVLAGACNNDDSDDPVMDNPTTTTDDPGSGGDGGSDVEVKVAVNEILIGSETEVFKGVWDKPSEPTGNGTTTLLRLSGQDGTAFDLIFEGDDIEAGTYKIADPATLVPEADEVIVLAGKGNSGPLVPTNPGTSSLSISIDAENTYDVKLAEIGFQNQFDWQEDFDDIASFHAQFNLSKNNLNGTAPEAHEWTTVEFTAPSNFWVSTASISNIVNPGGNVMFNVVGPNFASDNVASTTTNLSDQGLAAAFSGTEGVYMEYLVDFKTFRVVDATQQVTYEITDNLISFELDQVQMVNALDATETMSFSATVHILK